LVEALGAGLPVVATAFPHAVELLEDGAGIVVPHRDPQAMADAISTLLTNDEAHGAARSRAADLGRSLHWSQVADRCEAIAASASRTLLVLRRPTEKAARKGSPAPGRKPREGPPGPVPAPVHGQETSCSPPDTRHTA